jgi:hypothetical protein
MDAAPGVRVGLPAAGATLLAAFTTPVGAGGVRADDAKLVRAVVGARFTSPETEARGRTGPVALFTLPVGDVTAGRVLILPDSGFALVEDASGFSEVPATGLVAAGVIEVLRTWPVAGATVRDATGGLDDTVADGPLTDFLSADADAADLGPGAVPAGFDAGDFAEFDAPPLTTCEIN